MFSIKFDVNNLQKKLDEAATKQIPFATALALTRTAQAAKAALLAEIMRVFDRPTPFITRQLYVKPATKQNQEAFVVLQDWSFLKHQVYGGTREKKRTEENLRGQWIAPGWAAPLNAYGNIQMSLLNRIVSQLKLQRGTIPANETARSKKRSRAPRYFAQWERSQWAAMPKGVYERRAGGKPRLILAFIKGPKYRKRLAAAQIIQRTFDTHFKREWDKAFGQAMGSAIRRKL